MGLEQEKGRPTSEARQLLGLLVHDLRAPLARVSGAVETLVRSRTTVFDTEQQTQLAGALNGIGEIRSILEGATAVLENLERHETGTFTLDLRVLAAQVTTEVTSAVHSPETCIRVGRLPVISATVADRFYLAQILKNLVGNAIKYRSRDEGLVVIIDAADDDDGQIVYSVIDRGPGPAEDDLELMFEPFVRLDTNEAASGLGLGLALCRRVVSGRGGRIWAEVSQDHGMAVRFTLPTLDVMAWPGAPDVTLMSTTDVDA